MCSCVEVRAWCDDAGGVATVTNIAFVTVLWFSAPTGKTSGDQLRVKDLFNDTRFHFGG